ncbi:MAG: ImcF-related family protein [Bryobacteraceae bacterium]|nr:ImcF-related family protein [Bryobacteraceae bacterium]
MSPTNLSPVYLIGLAALAVCIAGVVSIWWSRGRSLRKSAAQESTPGAAAAPPPSAPGSRTVEDLFHEANHRLKLAPKMKGASVASLPAFLLAGPPGAGKTSVMMYSGLEPELLAGQVYQGAEVCPTATLNIWLAHQAIFIEIPAPFATNADVLKVIVKHLKPSGIGAALRRAQPPRAVLLCMNQAQVSEAATPGEIAALARPWNECLSLVAAGLGVQLPVYALFTRLDGVTGFAEFVSNLSPKESAQAVGAATRPFNAAADGAYAEQTARMIDQHFSDIAYALCDSRLPVLRREQNRAHIAVGYQFPREFQKLQKNLAPFLVEVGRPSRLQVSPFLRGFYLCGTRKVAVDQPGRHAGGAAAQPVRTGALDATTVLSPEQIRMQMAAAEGTESRPSSYEITEWLFVPAVFEAVLLRDNMAHDVSSASSRTNRVRTAACTVLAVLGCAVAAALTFSYAFNRQIEKELVSAARRLDDRAAAESPARRLEQMRDPLQRLVDYRSHTPLRMTWGLYPGKDLLPPAQAIYCAGIKSLVLQPVAGKMARDLAAPGASGLDPSSSFRVLKAYMMMTTHPQYADESFLSEQLFETWKSTPAAATAAEGGQLLPNELRLYGSLLSIPDAQTACLFAPVSDTIPTAQEYLRSLNLNDHYQSLLALAGKGLAAVNYDQKFPNDAVHDPQTVPACFTRQGWAQMDGALNHLGEALKADAWVLGETPVFTQDELARKTAEYRTRYTVEYKQAWMKYLEAASVSPYANPRDAAAKLGKMSGQDSYLLKLIELAAEHTRSIDKMKDSFQPATQVGKESERFQPAGDYLKQLAHLKNKLSTAGEDGSAADLTVQDAVNDAKDSTDRLAILFQGDARQVVNRILLDPITGVSGLIKQQNAGALNDVGRNLCSAYPDAFPFSPRSPRRATSDQVHRMFDRPGGEMWQVYDQSLRDSVNCAGDTCSEKPNPKFKLQPRFLAFFNGLYHWDRLLESGGAVGRISLSLRAVKFNQLKSLSLTIDDQHFTLPAGGDARTITWDVNSSQKLSLDGEFEAGTAHELFSPEAPGRWALFEWLDNSEGGGGGEFYWVPKSGVSTRQHFPNGQPKDYKVEIQLQGGSALDRRFLNLGACSPQASR